MTVHLCSFSGSVAHIKKKYRSTRTMLEALERDPLVSFWDASENGLGGWLNSLESSGYVTFEEAGFPWWKYTLTDKGKEYLRRPEAA